MKLAFLPPKSNIDEIRTPIFSLRLSLLAGSLLPTLVTYGNSLHEDLITVKENMLQLILSSITEKDLTVPGDGVAPYIINVEAIKGKG